jgi:trans-2,3-dihydro-3-hydroxyanthranilate isomerase
MEYTYYICDVFTDTRFGGNPLAVLPDAQGLETRQMQQIAREFNFSESTFVLPAEQGNTRRVRIFTPATEMPFAGHPNVGTAFVLATTGELAEAASGRPGEGGYKIIFEELAGLVSIQIEENEAGGITCEIEAPEPVSVGASFSAAQLAEAVSLDAADVVTTTHLPIVASVGYPFVFAELASRDALERARPNGSALEAFEKVGVAPDLHVYVKSGDEFDLRARMFAPQHGIPEDPATGGANCALGGLLAHLDEAESGAFEWRIAQGVELGRPSVLTARADKRDGEVVSARIGGTSVMVAKGVIEID